MDLKSWEFSVSSLRSVEEASNFTDICNLLLRKVFTKLPNKSVQCSMGTFPSIWTCRNFFGSPEPPVPLPDVVPVEPEEPDVPDEPEVDVPVELEVELSPAVVPPDMTMLGSTSQEDVSSASRKGGT